MGISVFPSDVFQLFLFPMGSTMGSWGAVFGGVPGCTPGRPPGALITTNHAEYFDIEDVDHFHSKCVRELEGKWHQ